jgi:hypothetical protein
MMKESGIDKVHVQPSTLTVDTALAASGVQRFNAERLLPRAHVLRVVVAFPI